MSKSLNDHTRSGSAGSSEEEEEDEAFLRLPSLLLLLLLLPEVLVVGFTGIFSEVGAVGVGGQG